MKSLFSPSFHRLFVAAACLLQVSPCPAQEAFEARFETDTAGTWLVYPSEPGWHYTVQYSTDLSVAPATGEPHFENDPDGYGYGTGGDLRFFVSPQLTPPAGGGEPPEKTLRILSVNIQVCNTPEDTRVEVSGQRPNNTHWHILAPQTCQRSPKVHHLWSLQSAPPFWDKTSP